MSGQEIFAPVDAFQQFNVKELGDSDFWVGNNPLSGKPFATPTALRSTKCHIILFYAPISLDPLMKDIWSRLKQDIAGPEIAAVNVSARTELMDAFFRTAQDPDHPLNDFTISGTPTILVYRNGWPQAFYNGELSYDALKKWIIVLACKSGYKEPDSTFRGVASVNPDFAVKEVRTENYPYPTSSRSFTSQTGENSSTRGGDNSYINSNNTTNQNDNIVNQQTQDIGFFDEDSYF